MLGLMNEKHPQITVQKVTEQSGIHHIGTLCVQIAVRYTEILRQLSLLFLIITVRYIPGPS
jgi:hypothetical protein